jgi:Skp family chaperone for outer membrane proteins
MLPKIGAAQLLLYVVLVLVGAGAAWGVIAWMNRVPVTDGPDQMMQLGGPVIPGLCVLSRQAVFDASQVGKSASAQFKTMRDTTQAQVNGEQTKLMAEAKALEGQKASLSSELYLSRQQDLAKRLQGLRQEAAVDSRDLEATRKDVVARIWKETQPVIAAVYKDKHCGLLVSRDAVMAGNPAMDITPAIVSGLDGRLTTIAVERLHVNAAPAQPAP